MSKREWRVSAVVLSFITLGVLAKMACAAEVRRMSAEELKSMLASPEVVIIDVRTGGDWDKSKEKIKGAVREDPNKDAKSWAGKYPKDKTVVLYCA
jgi:rhodanese-related sulfurtransferase